MAAIASPEVKNAEFGARGLPRAPFRARASGTRFSDALVVLALSIAMLLGGSGSMVPVPEVVLECVFGAIALAWVWTWPWGLRRVPPGAWLIAALLVALPLCQLLPLPPALWHSLPSRAVEQAALGLVDLGDSWRPLTLTPNRTLAALLAMMVPAVMLVMVAAQDRRSRSRIRVAMAGLALLSVLIGAAQLSGGPGNGFRFYNPQEPFLDGFQTNHNAQADVLLIGLVALAGAAADFPEMATHLSLKFTIGTLIS